MFHLELSIFYSSFLPIFRLLIFFSGILWLGSCGVGPPKSAEFRHVFEYTKDKIQEIERAGYAGQARGKAMGLYQKVPYIIYAKQGQSLKFTQQAVEPQADSLVYSLGNGRYRLTRNLYMGMVGKKVWLSFDGSQWFDPETKSASPKLGLGPRPRGGGSAASVVDTSRNNLEFRLQFQVVPNGQMESWQLAINYQAELIVAKELSYDKVSKHLALRPVLHGSSGDFLSLVGRQIGSTGSNVAPNQAEGPNLGTGQRHDDEVGAQASGTVLNLQKGVIFFPKGLEFYYRLYLLGNIIEAATDGPVTRAQFLRNVYFYYPSSFFASISFDGKDWSENYFGFRIKSFSRSVFLEERTVQYSDGIYIYHKN